ncbi:MAG: DUF362 domain-containing protein [Gemmataceae bacterium]
MELPLLHRVRQTAPQPVVADVAGTVRRLWATTPALAHLSPGARIAVGCGSRGIQNYFAITLATVQALQARGFQPFIVSAMGSHGGANPAGQRELLAGYGLTEAALGVPIRTEMDVIEIGRNSFGEPVWWDQNALAADAVVTISRVKPHTDFRGAFESGILKMLVIGLGKRHGADQHHNWGTRGLQELMPDSAKVILAQTKFVAGLAILENAREETGHLEIVSTADLFSREPILLEQARGMMGRLPFDQLDLLLVGECGKNYSGAGLDPNVVGRLLIEASPEMELAAAKPRITRIGLFDISPESHGNGTGIGIADLTTERALAAIDPVPFRMNNLTARTLWRSKLPIAFSTDREMVQACIETCWQPIAEKRRLAMIPNTLEVAEMMVSPALLPEVLVHPHLEVDGEAFAFPFDAAGQLDQEFLFPHSVRARRNKPIA